VYEAHGAAPSAEGAEEGAGCSGAPAHVLPQQGDAVNGVSFCPLAAQPLLALSVGQRHFADSDSDGDDGGGEDRQRAAVCCIALRILHFSGAAT
jgi:hypothetical protein